MTSLSLSMLRLCRHIFVTAPLAPSALSGMTCRPSLSCTHRTLHTREPLSHGTHTPTHTHSDLSLGGKVRGQTSARGHRCLLSPAQQGFGQIFVFFDLNPIHRGIKTIQEKVADSGSVVSRSVSQSGGWRFNPHPSRSVFKQDTKPCNAPCSCVYGVWL